MRRREFLSLVGGAAASWPITTHGQQPARPIVGFLTLRPASSMKALTAAFRKALEEAGYQDGRNVAIEFRYAEGRPDVLPQLAGDLAHRGAAVIVTTGGAVVARTAMTAMPTTPIVFTTGADPVRDGLVASLGRPGGRATGVAFITFELQSKRFALLAELLPNALDIAYLIYPDTRYDRVAAAAKELRRNLIVVVARSESEFDQAFSVMRERQVKALLVSANAIFNGAHARLIALAAHYAIPASYPDRESVVDGGLISYGPNLVEGYRQVGIYAAKILSGTKPSDLPVVQSDKLDLALNLKTAKALGLTIPPTLLARADEVIE